MPTKPAPLKPRKTPPKRKPGRPTKFTLSLAESICQRTASGETLTKICQDLSMPNRSNVWKWTEKHPEFRNNLTRAREEQGWTWAYQAVDIADEATDHAHGQPGTGEAGARVMAQKLRVDTRLKLIGRLNSRLSETVKQEISGPNGGPIATELAAKRTAAEDAEFAQLLAQAHAKAMPPTA